MPGSPYCSSLQKFTTTNPFFAGQAWSMPFILAEADQSYWAQGHPVLQTMFKDRQLYWKSVTNKQKPKKQKTNKKPPNNKCFLLFLQRRKFSSFLDSLNTFHLLYMLMCVHSRKIQKRVLVVCFFFLLQFSLLDFWQERGGKHATLGFGNIAQLVAHFLSIHEALASIPITK